MRAVIQRVAKATLKVDGKDVGVIQPGLVLSVGVARNDASQDAEQLAHRVLNMRVFNNEEGRMSRSLKDVEGQVIVLNHVAIMGDTGKGRRPSFTYVAAQEKREKLIGELIAALEAEGVTVYTAGQDDPTSLEIEHDGPITMLADTKRLIKFRKRRFRRSRFRRFYRRRGYYRDRYRDRYRPRRRRDRDYDRGYDRGYDRPRGYNGGRDRDYDRGYDRDRDYDRGRYGGRYDDRDRR